MSSKKENIIYNLYIIYDNCYYTAVRDSTRLWGSFKYKEEAKKIGEYLTDTYDFETFIKESK